MIAHLSCGGYAAYMIQTIASNVHKSKEKALSRLLEQQPAVTGLYSRNCRNTHLSLCLMQCLVHENDTLYHLIYYRQEG